MRFRAASSLFLVLFLLMAPLAPATADGTTSSEGDVQSGLELSLDKAVALLGASPINTDSLPVALPDPVRIGLISSGVDLRVFPESLRDNFTILGNGGDAVGYGTWAASVLLQLSPNASITSIGVYPAGTFNSSWQENALRWVSDHAKDLDVVLYAIPPHEFLDPISAAMAAGTWEEILDAMSDNPLRTSKGVLMGVAMDHSLRQSQLKNAGATDRRLLESFAQHEARWYTARDLVKKLVSQGVSFVVPSGDLGPGLQTVLGIANFPEVVTVGGWNGSNVSPKGSSGPSMDGKVKPDLIAPTGVPGFLPARSPLAASLRSSGLLSNDLKPMWDAADAITDARAIVDSSITASAFVAAAVGGMSREGIRDADVAEGALTAAAVPIDGVPVWRQGAGLLRFVPDAEFARSRSLALGHGDLGLQPEDTSWSTFVPFSEGQSGGNTVIDDFAGVSPVGTFEREADSPPPVAVSITNDGVRLDAPTGQNSYEGGIYCGYTYISIPTTGSDTRPGADVHGIPVGMEQVPTCLVQGTRLRAFNFYIHDTPAENLTFGLLPALPKEASIIEKPLMMLPIDPLHTKLFFKVSGPDGYTDFFNIPPGYYKLRQWSDYGAPITETLVDSKRGNEVVLSSDIGENPSYESFDALVLSSTGWTEADLKKQFGEENVELDKPTMGYFVTIGPRKIRVVLGNTKKMPGPGVSSRYIDLVRYEDIDFGALDLSKIINAGQLSSLVDKLDSESWEFSPQGNDGVEGVFNPAFLNGGWGAVTGVGFYPFNLTTPNYKAHMSLNFSYELENAVIVVVVQMGEEALVAAVTPNGTVQLPTVGPFTPVNLNGLVLSGRGEGKANFEFHLKPKGASQGLMTFLFVPSQPVAGLLSPLARVEVDDMSFELDTWTNTQWPAAMTGEGQGHIFSFSPNFSERQMSSGACRAIDNGKHKAEVCEDWRVMIHSPGDDAATVDLLAGSSSIVEDLRSAGAAYFDPRRGTADFSSTLAFAANLPGSPIQANLVASLPFKTNGRFWEQLVIPTEAARKHPGKIDVHIIDNIAGRASALFPHFQGGAKVSPYVRFTTTARFLALQ